MGHYIVLFVLWAFCMNITLELEMSEDEMKTVKAKFCGKHLADMLSMVCDGIYNTKQKKSGYAANSLNSRGDYEDNEPVEYSEDGLLTFPFRSKQQAKSIIPLEFRKRSEGIVNECCYKACSMWELTGYCGKR